MAQCCGVRADFQIVNFLPSVSSPIPSDRRLNFAFVLAGLGTFSNFFGLFGGQPNAWETRSSSSPARPDSPAVTFSNSSPVRRSGGLVAIGSAAAELATLARWQRIDVLDGGQVIDALRVLRPRAIFHCAGLPHVAESWDDTAGALAVNVLGTHRILDAVDRLEYPGAASW